MADPSVSAFSGRGNYVVFLSFRGFDTRKIFVGHLLKALQSKALSVFIDTEELKKGDILWVLLKAIEVSKLSVVVLSQNYANSKWCLIELVKIMECMDAKNHIVVPIFYQVEPADVRYVGGTFKEAFSKHGHNLRVSMEELQRWKDALGRVGTLSGWDSRNYEDDAKLIDEIAKDVFQKLLNTRSRKSNDLVGMDSHLRRLKSRLRPNQYGNDVQVVGIWGMGGLGKTTIAKAIYDEMCGDFKHHCFLRNVKEEFKRKGEAEMQEDLLFRILKEKVRNLSSNMIMEMLSEIKLFLVLDDVDNSAQIDALLGKQRLFGRGSRIIITTRDKGLLREFDIYEPGYLHDYQALELFKKSAFKASEPLREYDPLLQRAIEYAQGLPLALIVLGASLYKKSIWEWEGEFEKIKKFQHLGIEAVLRTSYEGLDHLQKMMFLDIASFYRGMRKAYVTEIMDDCGFFPVSELPVLVDRALVTDSGDYFHVLDMHDLLVDMALGIDRRELGHSRLTDSDEIEEVLTQNMDTKAVESIDLDLNHLKNVNINAKAFADMTKLRLLRIHYNRSKDSVDYYGSREEFHHPSDDCKQHMIGDFEFLSHELRCLIWHGCPLNSLPYNFRPKNLVDLDMRCSRIKQLWEGTKPLKKLKYLDLSLSPYLEETPDLTHATNLEKANFEGCVSLLKVHPSISDLKNLVSLSLKGCKELKILPRSFCMKSLNNLELSGCSNLEIFPEIPEVMKELQRLCLDKTAMKKLPSSVENLRGLVTLSLKDCKEFQSLPSSICRLKSLRYVTLSGCSKFKVFPKIAQLEDMEGLIELHLDGTSITEFMPSLSALNKLVFLSVRDCKELKSLPSQFQMETLETLVLSGCSKLRRFPHISEKMHWLSKLSLDNTSIEELPPSIKYLCYLNSLSLTDCGEVKSLPSSIFELNCLTEISVSGCLKFEEFPEIFVDFEGLDHKSITTKSVLWNLLTLRLEDCGELKSLPRSICLLSSLRFVSLSGCLKFEEFPEILVEMQLRELHLDRTSIKMLSPSIERLTRLILLNMRNCRSLVFLPDNICNLPFLTGLTLTGCFNLHTLPKNLGKLGSLLDIEIEGSGITQPLSLLHLKKSVSSSTNCLVGMDRHVNEMQLLLCPDQVDDVCIVGVCGIGGIGKTTIAAAVYDNLAPQFEYCCFLENVNEGFTKHGAVYMREELLSRISNEKVQGLCNLDRIPSMVMENVGTTKVLLILDDIDEITQIETLLGMPLSFGGGSKIIITTREEQIMSGYKIYCPKLLNAEALELFMHFAFRTIKPSGEYDHLSQLAIESAQGLPINLKVLGGYLYKKSVDEWKMILKFKHTVYRVFVTSFYELDFSERNILLDVAWFFKGRKEDYAMKILHSCGFFPYSALRVLIDRSLIAISDKGTLKIHDLLDGIVRDCVRHEDEHDPANRSRLYAYQGIRCLSSSQNLITEAVEAITLDLSNSKEVNFNAEAFVTMRKLRLLEIHDNGSTDCKQHVNGNFEFMSQELRCFIWHRYPLKSLPSYYHPKNLVDLDMPFSCLEQLWEGNKRLKNLTFVNLSHSQYLKKTPNLTEATNLEKLILDGCTSLLEVHPSIWNHKKLVLLSLKGCKKLEILSSSFYMKSLKTLNLDGCVNLEKFPHISEVMMELSEIYLDETAIKELPSSMERIQGLNVLSMRNCRRLVSLPDSICGLAHLTVLNLSGCSKLSYFPDSLRNTQSFTIIGIEELPLLMINKETENEGIIRVSETSVESGGQNDGTEEMDGVEVQGDECSIGGKLGAEYSCLSWLGELYLRGRELLSRWWCHRTSAI
ncbi:disease resistance protein RPV1-like isoform X2 [Argentina anserina]|uniref:disease resistance protein RPV1-like isoform X2 n=1 Tax=Argentina anserina TaxID=57926 RepID=UPI002176691D|nr:disease resistance protein RPV1-like isoform X2 [Potentilla anserina]